MEVRVEIETLADILFLAMTEITVMLDEMTATEAPSMIETEGQPRAGTVTKVVAKSGRDVGTTGSRNVEEEEMTEELKNHH